MKKFLILYKAPVDAMAQTASASPEQQAKGMEAWMQWAKKTGSQLIEMGSPLTNARQLDPDRENHNSKKSNRRVLHFGSSQYGWCNCIIKWPSTY